MPMCLYVGDSIAQRLQAYDRQCEVAAMQGASAATITSLFRDRSGDTYTVISMGTNQPDADDNLAQMARLRMRVDSPVIWILPYNRAIATRVRYLATVGKDLTIDLANFPSDDGIHPSAAASKRITAIIQSVKYDLALMARGRLAPVN